MRLGAMRAAEQAARPFRGARCSWPASHPRLMWGWGQARNRQPLIDVRTHVSRVAACACHPGQKCMHAQQCAGHTLSLSPRQPAAPRAAAGPAALCAQPLHPPWHVPLPRSLLPPARTSQTTVTKECGGGHAVGGGWWWWWWVVVGVVVVVVGGGWWWWVVGGGGAGRGYPPRAIAWIPAPCSAHIHAPCHSGTRCPLYACPPRSPSHAPAARARRPAPPSCARCRTAMPAHHRAQRHTPA